MVKNKKDLRFYLICDKTALGETRKKPKFLGNRVWKFEILYRKTEFLYNNRNRLYYRLKFFWYNFKFKQKCLKYHCEFPYNVIGPGLSIWHLYDIIISPTTKIGYNFSINRGCVVGMTHDKTPIILNNVEMMMDSKVLGGVFINNNTTIGANALVLKNINNEFETWGGVPAKKISNYNNSYAIEREKNINKIKMEFNYND